MVPPSRARLGLSAPTLPAVSMRTVTGGRQAGSVGLPTLRRTYSRPRMPAKAQSVVPSASWTPEGAEAWLYGPATPLVTVTGREAETLVASLTVTDSCPASLKVGAKMWLPASAEVKVYVPFWAPPPQAVATTLPRLAASATVPR